MKLFVVALLLAAVHALPGLFALLSPGRFGASLRQFARNVPVGIVLMLGSAGWFWYNLYNSDLTDFAAIRPYLYGAVILVGVGNCFFVQDYIAVRGAAVLALLLCDKLLDWQRWHVTAGVDPQSWLQPKNVIALWCYFVVIVAIWLVHSPYRLRDWLAWASSTVARTKQVGGGLVGFGAVLTAVALLWLR